MKLSERYKLLKENEVKIPVIEAITQFHPGMGTELGWSWYKGGMNDTGGWYEDKMLSIELYTLRRQLEIWEEQRDAPLPHPMENEGDALKEWWRKREAALIWGDGKV